MSTDESNNNFAQLIGPPALLPGEDAAQYDALRAEVRKCFEPKNVLDETIVGDVTDKIWEAQRYKKLEVQIMEGERVSALGHLLMPIFNFDSKNAFNTANMYFGQDPGQSKRAKAFVAKYNITEETIYAKALAQQSSPISYIERMVSNREVTRNGLLREHERRQRRAARAARKSGANDNEAEVRKEKQAKKTATS